MVREAATVSGAPGPMIPEGAAAGQLSLSAKARQIRTRAGRERRPLFGAELSLSLLATAQEQRQADAVAAAVRQATPKGDDALPAAARAAAKVKKLGLGAPRLAPAKV